MSKARKILLIVASALIIGGGALAFGAFAATGFDVDALTIEEKDMMIVMEKTTEVV